MKPMLVLGIMSGTSIDGVDYALCEVSRSSVRLIKHWAREFPTALQHHLHAAAANECSAHELAQLHHDLGRLFAQQAKSLRPRSALVGLHGQTVFHNPDRRAPATLQLGEPAYLAEALRVPVISNFRSGDIAAGGQGAPLATLFHKMVFAQRGRHVCVNNLGGISNVTSLDWRRGKKPRIMAFDTGPANVLIDLAMRELTCCRLSQAPCIRRCWRAGSGIRSSPRNHRRARDANCSAKRFGEPNRSAFGPRGFRLRTSLPRSRSSPAVRWR
jgi:anhydro-N-acetylmuramic acid kinase